MEEYNNKIINAAVNILAVEYLVKTNDEKEYGRRIDQLYNLDDYDLSLLGIALELNMHIDNLGEMITQGDYEYQKEALFKVLDEKED